MENDIEIVIPPNREFDRLDLLLVRYEGDPDWYQAEWFNKSGYWQIKADGNMLAYGYGWAFGREQLDYYAKRMLQDPFNIAETFVQRDYSESTKKLIALGAFGGPNEPTNKEKWESRKK
jgi:hypothetical protein